MNANLSSRALTILMLSALAPLVLANGAQADPVVPNGEHCVVNVRADDALNMRERPSANAPIAARKRYDECGILVTDACQGSWCPVEDGHSLGWVHRRYIAMVSPARYCVAGVALGDRLSLRAYPSPQSRLLTSLARHQCNIAFLPYAAGNWQKI